MRGFIDIWCFARLSSRAPRSWREFAKCRFTHFPSIFSLQVDTYGYLFLGDTSLKRACHSEKFLSHMFMNRAINISLNASYHVVDRMGDRRVRFKCATAVRLCAARAVHARHRQRARVSTESDDQHVGKDSAENVGKEANEKQDGVCDDKPDQHRPSCPCVDRFRHHGMRGSPRHGHGRGHCHGHGRRHKPSGMHRRCHRGFGAHSYGPPWSTGPGEYHQPGYPTGWGEFPFPPPFFGPSPWDCTGDANDDPENDAQKQDAGTQTREAPGRFSSLVSRRRRMDRPCVRPGQKHCDKRDKLLSMLSWKRGTLKYKLQRIESFIERIHPSDDETQETMTMTTEVDASRQQASSMDVTPQEGATIDVTPQEGATIDATPQEGATIDVDADNE